MTKQCFNNRQLEPENNPECDSLVKDSKTNTNQKNLQQNNPCGCSCEEVTQ